MIKTMKESIYRIVRCMAAPFRVIGLVVCLLVAHAEGEYEPYEKRGVKTS